MLGFPLEIDEREKLIVIEKVFLKKFSRNSTFLEFITIKILKQGTKSIFLEQNSSPRVEIQLKPAFEVYKCIFAEKWVSVSRNFKINQAFWHHLNVDITERHDAADTFWLKKCICCLWIN